MWVALTFTRLLGDAVVKNGPTSTRDVRHRVWSLGQEDPLEKKMATHSGILVHYKDKGAWWATVHGVAKSWTWLRGWAHPFSTVHLNGKIFTVISSIHIVRPWTIPSLSLLFLSFPQRDQTLCPCTLARWVTPGGWPLSVLVYKSQLWPTLMGDVQPVTWTLQHIKTTCDTSVILPTPKRIGPSTSTTPVPNRSALGVPPPHPQAPSRHLVNLCYCTPWAHLPPSPGSLVAWNNTVQYKYKVKWDVSHSLFAPCGWNPLCFSMTANLNSDWPKFGCSAGTHSQWGAGLESHAGACLCLRALTTLLPCIVFRSEAAVITLKIFQCSAPTAELVKWTCPRSFSLL